MVVDDLLKTNLRSFSSDLTVPRDLIGEHMLEIASFYMERILSDKTSKDILRRHLIQDHQKDDGKYDNEAMLRLGEGRNMVSLVTYANKVMESWKAFLEAAEFIKKTQNAAVFDAHDKQLRAACIELAMYLNDHPVGY